MMKQLGLLFALTSSILLTAAPDDGFDELPPPPPPSARQNGSRRGMRPDRGMFGGRAFKRLIAEEELAAKYPKEMEAVFATRLQEEAKLVELARKAGVELPESQEIKLLKVRAADPKAFAAAVARLKDSPRDGMEQLRKLAEKAGIKLFPARGPRRGGERREGDRPPEMRKSGRVDFKKLRRKYPEEMKEYEKLRTQDQDKARALLMELIERDRSSEKGR